MIAVKSVMVFVRFWEQKQIYPRGYVPEKYKRN